jgi:choline-sulfatase
MPRRPNIIVCLCDQLRWAEVGCYGNPVIRTPHMDRLAREGVRFEQAVTNFPVCMAARSVLLSGQYNRTCTGGIANVNFETRPGDCAMPEYPDPGRPHLRDTTLPETLRALGYETAVIGKWHVHSWPNDVGFDHWLIPRVHHCHSGQSYTNNGGPEFVPAGWSVDFEAERVEHFLGQRAGSQQPFFLYYAISPPHCPLADAPEHYLKMYAKEDIPLRPNVDLSRRLDDEDYWLKVYRWDFRYYSHHLPYTEVLPEGYDLRQVMADYYGLTTWTDDAVGRMLAVLDDTGLADDTIVVFSSDHGDNLGSLGLVQKGGPNEESARIPLLWRHPACIEPRVVTDRVASLVDVAPSLIAAAGGDPPRHMAGRYLFEPTPSRPHAFIEGGLSAAIRTPSHLYGCLRDARGGPLRAAPTWFYDLEADPYQMTNLAGTGAQAGVAAELDAVLREWDGATPWMA